MQAAIVRPASPAAVRLTGLRDGDIRMFSVGKLVKAAQNSA